MQNNLIYALIVIPIVIGIALAIYFPFFAGHRTIYQSTVTDELIGNLSTNGTTFALAYPAVVDSLTGLDGGNSSEDAVCLPANSQPSTASYNSGMSNAEVTVFCNVTGPSIAVYADYTGYVGDAYQSALSAEQQTRSGFSLGALLPFILIALTVVAIVLGALGLKGRGSGFGS